MPLLSLRAQRSNLPAPTRGVWGGIRLAYEQRELATVGWVQNKHCNFIDPIPACAGMTCLETTAIFVIPAFSFVIPKKVGIHCTASNR